MDEFTSVTNRLGIFACNPVPYKAPLYRRLDDYERFEIEVFYGATDGARTTDLGFGSHRQWDIPLLDGYPYTVLSDYSQDEWAGFLYTINPGLFRCVDDRFDAILIHEGYFRLSSVFVLLAANLNNVPVLLHGPGTGIGELSATKRLAKSLYVRGFLSRVDAVLADCTANRRYYKRFGFDSDRIFTMRAAVDNDRFRRARRDLSSADVTSVYDELGLSATGVTILFVGKLIERKRPFDLLRAFADLDADLDASLVFVGDGDLRSSMESWCRSKEVDDVVFAGFRNQQELPRFYEAGDVFALPSSYDPSPKVLNEAMNFDLPIIASDGVGSAADLVQDNGFVYPTGAIDKLANHLEYLVSNPDERDAMGKRSGQIVNEWDYDQNVNAIDRAIKAVHGKNRR